MANFAGMIAVTGGTGMVGAHLLFELLKKGEKVRALKREHSSLKEVKRLFERKNGEGRRMFSEIEWVEGDLLDLPSLERLFEDVDEVYHTAALVSFEGGDKNRLLENNIEGTANVVNLLLDKKGVKLCHVSSIAALGRMSDVHKLIDENTHFSTSLSPSVYSVSKYESEREVWRGIEEGLDACIVNPSVILGPGNWEKGSAKLFKTVFDGLKFYTAGMNGFVGVDDLVEVMLRLMKEHVMGERFIVSAENVSYRQLFEWMAESLGVSPPRWKAGPILSGMAWRALQLRQHLTGKRSSITKETAKTAQQIYRYNHSKLKNKLDFTFTPIREVVEKTAKMFLEDHGLKKSDFT